VTVAAETYLLAESGLRVCEMDATTATQSSEVSFSAKLVLVAFGLIAALAFVVIAELGINAGHVHYGVRVGSVDIGGMTQIDAAKALEQSKSNDPLKQRMKQTAVTFTKGDLKLSVVPGRVGWRVDAAATADRAMQVGRNGVLRSAGDRIKAYLGGVSLPWAGSPSSTKVGFLLNHWAKKIRAAGYTFTQEDRSHFRYKIKRAMSAWPRTLQRIPVSGS
jgi:hypothetical protein